MLVRYRLAVVSAVLLVGAVFTAAQAVDPYWKAPMTTVHNTFKTAYPDEPFKVSRFGDSIFYSSAFFKGFLHHWNYVNLTVNEAEALVVLKSCLDTACWNWQEDAVAASHGVFSQKTSAWPLQNDQVPAPLQAAGTRNIDYWLAVDKPMVAIIMWGTNDVGAGTTPTVDLTTYTNNMRTVVQTCKANGTIPVLTTIPPRYDGGAANPNVLSYVQAIRDLATAEQVPLIDYYAEILRRRPANWFLNLIPGPDATLVPAGDGVHPSAAQAGYPDDESWKQASDFSETYLSKWGYTLLNKMALDAFWDLQDQVLHLEAGGTVTLKVYDTALVDVPGPQPIRTFPIPTAAKTDTDDKVAVAAGWADAEIVYDNYAEGLVFSNNYRPDYTSATTWSYSSVVSVPITMPKVVIHDVYNPGTTWPPTPITGDNAFTIEDTHDFYVTQEGSASDPNYVNDNRFPYRVPRLACDAWSRFMAVMFEFPEPVKAFGVFVPAASNNGPTDTNHDQNFYKQVRSVYLNVIDESDVPMSLYKSLKIANQSTYCPFVAFISDGVHGLKKVSIIHDQGESGMTAGGLISIMDAYIIPGAAAPLVGDINNDGFVNVGDLQALVAAWGSTGGPPASGNWSAAADINDDNFVNVGDLQLLVAHWGEHR